MMEEFLETHKLDIIYGIIVIIAVIILRALTNKLHNWLAKEKQRKFPTETTKPIRLLKGILNILWIALGLIALAYLVVDESQQSSLANDFKIVIYIGIVLSFTIISSTTSNIWFKHDIQKKIETEQDPTSFQFLRYMVLVGIYFIGAVLCLFVFPAFKGMLKPP